MQLISNLIEKIWHNLYKKPMGLQTGLSDLDNFIRGFKETEYIIVAGRPSMGKSAVIIDWLLNIAKSEPVGLYSLEMSNNLVIERMIANFANVSYSKMKMNMLDPHAKLRVQGAVKKLFNLPIYVNDQSLLTPDQIGENFLPEIKCLFIDYLQLMSFQKMGENRQQEIMNISRCLKAMAKNWNIPIIAVSQLNRQTEYRTSKRPKLSDLRESGALEQDADVVILVHRSSYYDELDAKEVIDTGEMELIIAKNKNGPTGIIKCDFDKESMSIVKNREEF